MKRPPRVSVLMPVWNPHPGFFSQAVRSVLAQTMDDFEIIMVEDPSDVCAAELLKPLHDRRIRHHINTRRTGIVEQLNTGLACCGADLVARFDADDLCHPQRLAKQLDVLHVQRQIAVVGSQIEVIDATGRRRGYRHYPITHQAIIAAMRRFNPLAHPSVMFRKQAVQEAGGYRAVALPHGAVPWCQDYDLWSRLAVMGAQFANHPATLLSYRIHGGQVKSKHMQSVLQAVLAIKQQYWRDTMDWRSRWRMLGEQLLVHAPPKLVLALFERFQIAPSERAELRQST